MQVKSIKSSEGKISGTVAGAGLAYLVLKNEKPVSFNVKKGIINGFYKSFLRNAKTDNVKETIENLGVTRKEFNFERTGIIKKILKISKGAVAAILVLGGLLVGGIVDKAVNKHRAKKAQNV